MATEMIEVGERIRTLHKRDPRFAPEAYHFVFEALAHTLGRVGERRHLSARELLEGIRAYAPLKFGRLSLLVLNHWGVRATEDFGEIVYNLIEAKLMGKTDTDSKEDFRAVYDFHEPFGAGEPLKVEWGDEG